VAGCAAEEGGFSGEAWHLLAQSGAEQRRGRDAMRCSGGCVGALLVDDLFILFIYPGRYSVLGHGMKFEKIL
jgi:hypothetical protein